jgi:hypothetical protein
MSSKPPCLWQLPAVSYNYLIKNEVISMKRAPLITSKMTNALLRPSEIPLKIVLKEKLSVIFLIFIIYLFLNIIHIGCPIKYLSGISCPGCGMTRSVIAVLQLNFQHAFHYHPLFVLTPVMLLLFLFENYINPKLNKILWGSIITLFLITYIFRMVFGPRDVVQVDISSSKMLQFIYNILGGN